MKAPALSVKTTENSATFTWKEVYGENQYNLKIWKGIYWDGDPYFLKKGASSPYIVTDLPLGHYEAYVDAVNYLEVKMSNVVSFDVKEEPMFTTKPTLTPEPSPTPTPTPTPSPTPSLSPTAAPKYFTVSGAGVINTADTAQTATIIIAKYSGNILTDVASQEITFAANEEKNFAVPEGGKLFVWDSLYNMRPLTK